MFYGIVEHTLHAYQERNKYLLFIYYLQKDIFLSNKSFRWL